MTLAGKVEWRVVCVHNVDCLFHDEETARSYMERRRTAAADPMHTVGRKDCGPWRLETRTIPEWSEVDSRVERGRMTVAVEYRVVRVPMHDEELLSESLNSHAREGWRVVSSYGVGSGAGAHARVILERTKKPNGGKSK